VLLHEKLVKETDIALVSGPQLDAVASVEVPPTTEELTEGTL
jgi:hypothetical protein